MAQQKFEEYYNMTQTERVKMANNATDWKETIVDFKTDVYRLIKYLDGKAKEKMSYHRKKGGKKGMMGKKKGRVTMLGSNEACNYDYQCESECCLEPRRRKGGKGKKGRGKRDDRLL